MSRLWLVLLAAGALVAAMQGGDGRPASVRPTAVATGGSLTISNSRSGMPIFTASNMGPGDSTSGTVQVSNTGSRTGFVWLSQRDLVGAPGALGGSLPERLRLDVVDLTSAAAPARVYSGRFASMSPQPLGYMAPGARRTYRFTATFPDGGAAADNAYVGSSASVAYVWTGVEGSPSARPPSIPPPGADTVAPRLTLAFARVQRILTSRRLLVRARCSESCRLDVRGVVRAGVLGAPIRAIRGRRLPAGRPARLALRFSARGMRIVRRALAARRPPRVRLSFSARDRAGNRRLVRRTVRLTRRRAPRVRRASAGRELEIRIAAPGGDRRPAR